jgi:hypothetical protein
MSYNASVVKIYNATDNFVHFENKNILLHFENNLAYHKAGVVCSLKF